MQRHPTSPVSFFQVEKERLDRGGAIQWGQVIRLKHVPTQMYLASFDKDTEDGEKLLGLTFKSDIAETGFVMVMDKAEGNTVISESYIRIQHHASGCWLHASEEELLRDGLAHGTSQPRASGLRSLCSVRWDGAKLLELRLIREKRFVDAYTIHKVPDELRFNVNFVAGFVPMLNRYHIIVNAKEGLASPKEYLEFCAELCELRDFMMEREVTNRDRQKVLRSLQVVDTLVQVLKSPFGTGSGNKKGAAEVVTRNYCTFGAIDCIFKVLRRFLRGSSRKNELYMCKHIPLFWKLFGTALEVEPMFNELVRDNIQILEAISKKEISYILQLIKGVDGNIPDPNPDYLEFLEVLCIVRGSPFKHLQKLVGNCVLSPENKGALVRLSKLKPESTSFLSRRCASAVNPCRRSPMFTTHPLLHVTCMAGPRKYGVDQTVIIVSRPSCFSPQEISVSPCSAQTLLCPVLWRERQQHPAP